MNSLFTRIEHVSESVVEPLQRSLAGAAQLPSHTRQLRGVALRHDAPHSLAVSFGIALRVLGLAIPLALLAALGLVRRERSEAPRREAALF